MLGRALPSRKPPDHLAIARMAERGRPPTPRREHLDALLERLALQQLEALGGECGLRVHHRALSALAVAFSVSTGICASLRNSSSEISLSALRGWPNSSSVMAASKGMACLPPASRRIAQTSPRSLPIDVGASSPAPASTPTSALCLAPCRRCSCSALSASSTRWFALAKRALPGSATFSPYALMYQSRSLSASSPGFLPFDCPNPTTTSADPTAAPVDSPPFAPLS